VKKAATFNTPDTCFNRIDLTGRNIMTDSNINTKFDRPAHLVATKSLRDILADLRKVEAWLLMAAFAAFLASAFFVVKYFVGGDMNPMLWTGEQWANGILGLGITAVITAAQAFLYSSGYKGPAAVVATVIVVFFGLFSEVSQSMEREDATVRHRSESSPVFQAALGSIGTLTGAVNSISPEQKALADARGQLQYWQGLKGSKQSGRGGVKYSHNTLDRNIARYQQQVASLEQQSSLQGENRAALLTGAIAQAKALEYDEDKHYAMIRLIKSFLGVAGIWASFLFSMIIIGTFEYAFHFVGGYVADHKRALLLLGRDTRGELIQPPVLNASVQEAGIPQDFGNGLRENYLNWVTPERTGSSVEPAAPAVAEVNVPPVGVHPAEVDSRPDPPKAPVRDLTRERFFKLVYMEIRTRILNNDLKPTVRPVTDAVTDVIRHHTQTLGLQPSLIGKPERQKIAEKILEKLAQETVLELNNEQGIGKAKYKLASRWVNQPVTEIPLAG
jgi:hypothetical protein